MPLACTLLLEGLCFYGPLLVVMLATVIMCGGKKKTTSNQSPAAPAPAAAAASKPPAQSKEAKDKPKEKAAPTPKADDADAGTVDGHYEDVTVG